MCSVVWLGHRLLGQSGLEGRSEQAVHDLECSARVSVLYLRCNGKLCKDTWLVNYLFYKDDFGVTWRVDYSLASQTFPNDKNYLQVIVNTRILGFYSKSREGQGSEFLTNVPGD